MEERSEEKAGRTTEAMRPHRDHGTAQENYAISMTFFGSERRTGTVDLSHTFARHRPTKGATTIEPNANPNATCMRISS